MIASAPRALPGFALSVSALALPVMLRGTDVAVAFAFRYTLANAPKARAAALGIARVTTPRGKALMSVVHARRAFWHGVFAVLLQAERAPRADGSVAPASLLLGLMRSVAKVPLVKHAAKPTGKSTTGPAAKPPKASVKKPAEKKPSGKQPVAQKPTRKNPATHKPQSKNPATQKPTSKNSATHKPTSKKPATQKPTSKKPAAQKAPVHPAPAKKR